MTKDELQDAIYDLTHVADDFAEADSSSRWAEVSSLLKSAEDIADDLNWGKKEDDES